jgi:hypothetical protein
MDPALGSWPRYQMVNGGGTGPECESTPVTEGDPIPPWMPFLGAAMFDSHRRAGSHPSLLNGRHRVPEPVLKLCDRVVGELTPLPALVRASRMLRGPMR